MRTVLFLIALSVAPGVRRRRVVAAAELRAGGHIADQGCGNWERRRGTTCSTIRTC